MRRRWMQLALWVVVCVAPLAAHGQSRGSGAARGELPEALVDRPLTLPVGVLELSAPLGINLSSGSGGKPTFLNPSISYGLSDEFTIGIRHYLGLCFSGSDGKCPEFYNDLSLNALYSLVRAGRLEIAAGASLDFAPIVHPSSASGELRLPIKFGGGLIALVLSPTLNFGLNERDSGPKRYGVAFNAGTYDVIIPAETAPNREVLRVPLTFQLQLASGPALIVGASVDGPLESAGGHVQRFYRIPVMFGVLFAPLRFLDSAWR